jgi:hypothetical protein
MQFLNLGEAVWHTGFPPSRVHHLAFLFLKSETFDKNCSGNPQKYIYESAKILLRIVPLPAEGGRLVIF